MTSLSALPLLRCADPDAPLVWRNGKAISARLFLHRARHLAAHLPARRHAINLCGDPYWFLLSFVAVLLRQQTNLLPPSQLPSVIDEIAASYPDSYRLFDRACDQAHDQASTPSLNIATLPGWSDSAAPATWQVPDIDAQHLAMVLFTSGSTGRPQAFNKPWQTLVSGADCNAQAHDLQLAGNVRPTVIGTVPAQHSYGMETLVMLPLQGYCALYGERPFYPQDIADALHSVPSPRILVTTPVHLRALTEAHPTLPALRNIWSATAPLSQTLAQRAEQQFHTHLHEIFGCTETGTCATRRTAQDETWTLMPAFTLQAISNDAAAGVQISAGHLPVNAHIQDQIEVIDAHHFKLVGRGADLINIAGKRASLADLNHKLLGIPGVMDGVVFLPDADEHAGVVRTAALVVAPTLSKEQLLQALRERIDPAFLPRPLYLVPALPRNEATKLPRATLLRYFDELRHASRT